MGVNDVYIGLAFQGRLRNSEGSHRAEISVLKEGLEEFGLQVLATQGYCSTTNVRHSADGAIAWIDFVLKTRGGWTPLVLEVRRPEVFVLHDR